jgi:uncharacterized protein YybS (DUF2232 family)
MLFVFYLLPLPIFLLVTRFRPTYGLLLAALAGGLTALWGWSVGGVIILFALIVGISMGIMYRKKETTGTDVVLAGLIASCVGILVIFGVSYLFIPGFYDWIDLLQKELIKVYQQGKEIGIGTIDPNYIRLNLFLPVMILLMVPPISFINFWLGRKWLSRRGFETKKVLAFRDWHLPKVFFYFYMVIMIGYLLSDWIGSKVLDNYLGVLFILQFLFMIQGLSLIAFWLHYRNKRRAWLVLAFFMLWTPLSMFIQLLGVVDVGFSLRKWILEKQKNKD